MYGDTADTRRIGRMEHAVLTVALLALWGTVGAAAQATNQITAVDPNAAVQGTSGLLVTFTLDSDVPPPPPAGVMPDSVTIGSIAGTSVTHDSQYVVTAAFDIPASASIGAQDVTVTFTTPHGSVDFTMSGGFMVTAGADMPPSIAQQPQSQTVPPGSAASFAVEVSGTPPLSYQWQKDQADISGATDATLVIGSAEETDAGGYRCVVTNDFGSVTSDEATLTVSDIEPGAYTIVDTGQVRCYDASSEITPPASGEPFHGQDAQHEGVQPSYALSSDGLTVYDNNTGLTWTRTPDLDGDGNIDVDDKLAFSEAVTYADDVLNPASFGGYSDWRLPSMKELYSLMDFRGTDPDPMATDPGDLTPFIDTNYFDFAYGDMDAGERIIDSQFWSSNVYVGLVFVNQQATFGLNLADGRIKGYPSGDDGPVTKLNYVYFCRGNRDYGINDFIDNGNGTVTDRATELMWMQDDSGYGMTWEDALAYAEARNAENYLGYSDWRLPNAKEMQSIVDYTRSPDTTSSAAIDPLFTATQIVNLAGEVDYPWYWTGTSHRRFDGSATGGVYVAFGRATGSMDGTTVIDVHGAGCQRSDPKDGDPNDYPVISNGPQGDVQRVFNYVRLVRDAEVEPSEPYAGYNLFAPLTSTTTYLMDNNGNMVHTWEGDYGPGNAVYLLDSGDLLRTGNVGNQNFGQGGAGGIIQQFSWCGDLVWEYEYSSTAYLQHHDIERLPNGNVLLIAWEYKSEAEALAAGRDPTLVNSSGLYPDTIIEVQPTGPDTGQIVWEWRVWDHLIQEYDAGKPNYGVVADHPELIDMNFATTSVADWNHVNSIDYNADLDQIVLSVHSFGEIWVIDHSTTTAEAAGHTGGNSGMGGDLLYRWGNPQAYGAGTADDQKLFVQHDAEWIADGLPGAGNILIFNNGQGRPDGDYSSVDEITPPVSPDGSYTLVAGSAYGPSDVAWQYVADTPTDFYAERISGAQRLPNGNTLICEGTTGRFFEVTPAGTIVWQYTNGDGGPGSSVFRVERHGLDDPAFRSVNYGPGDLDGDCAIDMTDVDLFAGCVEGPEVTITDDCTAADLDIDADADLHDIASLQILYGGE